MDEVTVAIDRLAPGGDAVGRHVDGPAAGRATFVPLAAPGERVRARLQRVKSRVAWAELTAIERPGPDRVAPPCSLFGRCGGCQWQHVARPAQLRAKADIASRALGRPVPIEDPGPSFGYRDRARFVVGPGGTLGLRARRSHEVIDVRACPLLGEELARALPAVRRAAARLREGTSVHVLSGREGVHATSAGQVLSDPDGHLVDAPDVDASEGDMPLRLPAHGFAQVGRAANRALVRAVMDAVGARPGRVVELHAGSGNFTRTLTGATATVEASDRDDAAVVRGRRNAPAARWSNAPPAARPGSSAPSSGSVDPSLADAPAVAGAADLVILDPPRQGAEPEALRVAAAARRVVYVSCEPQTLARDAIRLGRAGHVLRDARALDLMPHTHHVEVVAVFART